MGELKGRGPPLLFSCLHLLWHKSPCYIPAPTSPLLAQVVLPPLTCPLPFPYAAAHPSLPVTHATAHPTHARSPTPTSPQPVQVTPLPLAHPLHHHLSSSPAIASGRSHLPAAGSSCAAIHCPLPVPSAATHPLLAQVIPLLSCPPLHSPTTNASPPGTAAMVEHEWQGCNWGRQKAGGGLSLLLGGLCS